MRAKHLSLPNAIRPLSVLLPFLAACLFLGCRSFERPEQPKLRKVQLLIDWKAEPTYAGFYIAVEKGFFRARGLDVEILQGNGAPTSVKLISEGRYLMGSASGAATAIGKAQGFDIRSLAVFYHELPTVIYSLKETGIRKPTDLYGKRLGINFDSINYREYLALVSKLGLDRSRIKELGVGWDVAPLLEKKVDALMNYAELSPIQLQTQGYDTNALYIADYGVKIYSLNLVANTAFLGREPKLAADLRDGVIEGYQFVARNPDAASEIFLRLFPEKDPKFVHLSMRKVAEQLLTKEAMAAGIGSQSENGWRQTVITLDNLGLIKKTFDAPELIWQ